MVEHGCDVYTNAEIKEDRFSPDTDNMLRDMFIIQNNFQKMNKLDVPVCDLASAIMTEGGELWSASGGKWWKKYLEGEDIRGRLYEELQPKYLEDVEEQNKQEIIVESIDLLHFLLAVWLRLGVSAEEVYYEYIHKMSINFKRQEEGY